MSKDSVLQIISDKIHSQKKAIQAKLDQTRELLYLLLRKFWPVQSKINFGEATQGFFQRIPGSAKRTQKLNLELSFETESSEEKKVFWLF